LIHPIIKALILVVAVYIGFGLLVNYTNLGPWLEASIPSIFFDLFFTFPLFAGYIYLRKNLPPKGEEE